MDFINGKFGEQPSLFWLRIARAISDTQVGSTVNFGDFITAGAHALRLPDPRGIADRMVHLAAEQALKEMSVPDPGMVLSGAAVMERAYDLSATEGAYTVWTAMSERSSDMVIEMRRQARAKIAAPPKPDAEAV